MLRTMQFVRKLTRWKLRTLFVFLVAGTIAFYQILLAIYQAPPVEHLESNSFEHFIVPVQSSTTCRIPLLDPYSKAAKVLIEINGRYDGAPACFGKPVKFKVDYNTSSIIRDETDPTYWESVECCYTDFEYTNRTLRTGEKCYAINERSMHVPYEHSNLDIKCWDALSTEIVYRAQLKLFRPIRKIESKVDKILSSLPSRDRLSVLILGLDSVSHQNFVRYCRETTNLLQNLSALEFFGFNKVGSGTISNVIAMVSGCEVLNPLDPPYRVGDHCELMWKFFESAGYRTLHTEDTGFNARSLYPSLRRGLEGIGVDYSIYDFMEGVRAIRVQDDAKDVIEDTFGCFGNQFIMDVFKDYLISVAKQYQTKSYLNFVWVGSVGHTVMTNTQYMDTTLYDLLSELKKDGFLNDTAVFVVADHGPWHGVYLDKTEAGAIERLMPVLFAIFPSWFQEKYNTAFRNLKLNTKRLTTHYDLHQTFLSLTDLSQLTNEALSQRQPVSSNNQLGQTLFLPVPTDRHCESANIPLQFCMCLARSTINSPENDEAVEAAVTFAIIHLNSELAEFPLCSSLSLKSIIRAVLLVDRIEANKYPESTDKILEVTFDTHPSDGEFQATVNLSRGMNLVGIVLRTNIYKGQSDCISSWQNASYAKTMCSCKD